MKLNQPLIISLLLHLCLYLLALLTPSSPVLAPATQPIEVVYQNEKKNRQLVMDPNQEKLNEALAKLEKQAERLSRVTQRVQEESIASASGPTQNSNNGRQRSYVPSELPKQARQDLQKPQADTKDPDAPSITKPMPGTVAYNARTSVSTISEYVPEVRMGGFTALNSDQFVHYTFYARINEQIRSRWVDNLRNFIDQTSQTEVNRLASKTQSTQVEIILTPKGEFVKALIRQRAENVGLDNSVVTAFRTAAPLNNPPAEMVEADGFIHLHYGFYLQLKPRYLASGSK